MTGSLGNATAMTMMADGRILVCQQSGALRVVKNGALLTQPMLSLTVNSSGERGLLGVAVDPNFATTPFIYVYYTATSPAVHNRISRFAVSGDTANPASESILMELDNLGATNHNGGALHFGPDGKLYAASGDNANGNNAQIFTNVLGKILRLNSDGTIPADNPFVSQTSGKNQSIWAIGLRNPYTFTFQRGTGRMFINDVGENTWEEINDGLRGANYGWPGTEGETSNPAYVSPLFAYGHGGGQTQGCAIAGAAFYSPSTARFPASYLGKYFFADYCSAWIRTYDPATDTAAGFATGAGNMVDLLVSGGGKLYYLSRSALTEVDFPAGEKPEILTQPESQTISAGQPATFRVTASGAAPLSYQWLRGNDPIPGATSASYTIPAVALGDNGAQFRCVVSNSAGSATSDPATLTVPQTCTLNTTLSYAPNTLTVNYSYDTSVNGRLISALFFMRSLDVIVNVPVPAADPPATLSKPVSLPPSGLVGVLTTIRAPGEGGLLCTEWKTIFTGGGGVTANEELWRQALRSGLLTP